MSSDQSIREFLASLEKERKECEAEKDRLNGLFLSVNEKIAELDAIIPGIKKRVADEVKAAGYTPRRRLFTPRPTNDDHETYAGLSLRKAILKYLLAQGVDTSAKSADIAQFLKNSGVESKGADFGSNVSATLSVMQSEREEVRRTDKGWGLTEKGTQVATGI